MRFKFKAVKQNGEKYESVRESADRSSLYTDLKSEGDILISAEELRQSTRRMSVKFSIFDSVPTQQKIIFARNLGAMLSAGLSLARALVVLERQVNNPKLKNIISSIISDIKKGESLSESMKGYPSTFSEVFISMVMAGEESGKLSESLGTVASEMENSYKLKSKIRGAMIYPAVIISIMIVVGILMLIYVVPSLTATFRDLKVDLPMMTKVLIFASDFLKNNLIISILGIIAVIAGIYFASLSRAGKRFFDKILLGLPTIGDLVREANSARTTRTLSSLLSSGVSFSDSIKITKDVVQNSYFKDILAKSLISVEKGETISSVFLANTDICPIFVGEMMNVGEETGRLAPMLLEVANFYENSVEQKTKDLSTIVEPVLMVIIGVVVGFFAMAMITPIYSVMGNV